MTNRRSILQAAAAIVVAGATAPARLSAQTPARLIFVHGRAQQGLDPVKLQQEWLQALGKGARAAARALPAGLQVSFPYYGDVLDAFTREYQIPLASEMNARGDANTDEFLQFQAQYAEEIRKRQNISTEQIDQEYGNNPKPRGPLNWEWVQAILRAIDKNSPGMNQLTLETFTRDVFLYTRRSLVRDKINAIVAAELTTQPTVVVGHSLGSVVAYDVLRNRRDLRVPLFVTVGSPLAVRAVNDPLVPLRAVPNIGGWYNALDTRDVVALYPLDDANFPVQPPAIENYDRVRNWTENRHSIAGYLDDAAVAGHIIEALSRGANG